MTATPTGRVVLSLAFTAALLGCSASRPLDICHARGGNYPNASVSFEWKTDMLHYTEYVLRQCPGTKVAVYDGRLSRGDRRRMADLAFERIGRSADISVVSVTFVGRFRFDEKQGYREFHPEKIVELR